MLAVGTAVIGSLQFGYNTGVINAPQKVSLKYILAHAQSPSDKFLQFTPTDIPGVSLDFNIIGTLASHSFIIYCCSCLQIPVCQ